MASTHSPFTEARIAELGLRIDYRTRVYPLNASSRCASSQSSHTVCGTIHRLAMSIDPERICDLLIGTST